MKQQFEQHQYNLQKKRNVEIEEKQRVQMIEQTL